MMKFINRTILLFCFFALPACSNDDRNTTASGDPDFITIGTFNIQWLGDGIDDNVVRSEGDYERIAEVIKNSGADILALQEIENSAALARVAKHLNGYSFKTGTGGGPLNPSVLYKNNINVEEIGEYAPLEVAANKTRPGFVIKAKKGNFDFIMMSVHFKSTSRYDDTPEKKRQSYEWREKQAIAASQWADSIIAAGVEDDVIIAGDFNDTPTRTKNQTLNSIIDNPDLFFLTTDLKSCKFRSWYVIDHIVISDDILRRYVKGSERVVDTYGMYQKEYAERISDHCIVLATFDVRPPDND